MVRSGLFISSLLPAVMAYGSSYGGGSAAAEEPVAAQEGVQIVKVGDGGLTFDPAEITAAVGDKIEFHFWPQAHSVAQSSFDNPCQPLNTTGFFSGRVPVEQGMSDTIWTLTIEDDTPKWFYCATGEHCQNGMVGVINAPASGARTLEQYATAAGNAASNVEPESEEGGVRSTVGDSPTPTPTPDSAAMNVNVRWGLMSAGVAMVGFVAGLM